MRGPLKRKPRVKPVEAPAIVEARILSSREGTRTWCMDVEAPRVMFHQFSRPVRCRIEVRTAQNVVPIANHCAPEAMEKRTGVWVRRVPYRAPVTRPGNAGGVRHVYTEDIAVNAPEAQPT